MKDKVVTSIVAICGIVSIEIVALFHGINGTLLIMSIAAIAGIAGYKVGGVRKDVE